MKNIYTHFVLTVIAVALITIAIGFAQRPLQLLPSAHAKEATPVSGKYDLTWFYGDNTGGFAKRVSEGQTPTLMSASQDASGRPGLWVVWSK